MPKTEVHKKSRKKKVELAPPERLICGAKKRQGTGICKQPAGWGTKHPGSGKCKMHGGASTGPRDPSKLKGNRNGVKTGEFAAIWMDKLTPEEQALVEAVDTDELAQLNNEIKLLEIRERQMLELIDKVRSGWEKDDVQTTARHGVSSKNGSETMNETVKKKRATDDRLLAIHEALTRVQSQKARCLELKYKLTAGGDTEGMEDDGFLAALGAKAGEVWADGDTQGEQEE